ncbi:serine/arginine repetitive matrix protein 2-like [Macrobrachium nipponense]|uniref:serine/arginine repetitive matrix protein 2-like n=1 Tax=Macrobrachium nipponense TaxID=159736 RepID=UPI0030C868BA
MASLRDTVRSNESKVSSHKDPVARSQAALDRTKKVVLRQCFSSSSSPSPKRRWSASESSHPLKRTWKEPCALPSNPESFSEEPEIERKRTRRSQESSSPFHARASPPVEEFERSPARILAGLQAQISALADSLAGSSRRRKDVSLPNLRDHSPSRRSSPPSMRLEHDRRKELDRRSSPEYRSSRFKHEELEDRFASSRRYSPKIRATSSKRQELDRRQEPRILQDRSRRTSPGSRSVRHREDSRRQEPSRRQLRQSPSCDRSRLDRRTEPCRRFASDRRSSSEGFSPRDRRQEPGRRIETDRRQEPSRRKEPDRRSSPTRRSSVDSDLDMDRHASSSRCSLSRRSPSRRSPRKSSPPGSRSSKRHSSEEGHGASEEGLPRDSSVSSYKRLTDLLLQEFGDSLSAVAPPSPPSLFSTAKTTKMSSVVKMKPTVSMKKALRALMIGGGLRRRRGRPSFLSHLPSLRERWESGMSQGSLWV